MTHATGSAKMLNIVNRIPDPAPDVKKVYPDVVYESLMIDSAIAEHFLESMAYNRDLRNPRIEDYTRMMRLGLWKEKTGETIKLDEYGRMLDGQHRCWAVIYAKVALWFSMAYGVDHRSFDVLDTGTKRDARDGLGIAGLPHNTRLIGILKLIWKWRLFEDNKRILLNRKGERRMKTEEKCPITLNWNTRLTPSNAELIILMNEYGNEVEPTWRQAEKSNIMSAVPLGFVMFLLQQNGESQEDIEAFFLKVGLGIDLHRDSPEYSLVHRFSARKKGVSRTITPLEAAAMLIKTWNLSLKGETVKVLVWSSGEVFPTLLKTKK